MSNAFNLSQLANFVDSSGKVNIATGSTGTLPTTQGGTGLTTVGTNGQVLQSNGTSLTWATPASGGVTSLNGQTGTIDNTTQYAIGSYILGRPSSLATGTYNNSTIAGSSLYAWAGVGLWGQYEGEKVFFGPSVATMNFANFTSLVNTGSWRCVSISVAFAGNTGQVAGPGLWVRYA